MAGAFLGESAKKRPVSLHRDLFEPVPEHGEVMKAGEPDLFEDAGHFAQQVDRPAGGLPEVDPQGLQGEHRPLGEPATPSGSSGS